MQGELGWKGSCNWMVAAAGHTAAGGLQSLVPYMVPVSEARHMLAASAVSHYALQHTAERMLQAVRAWARTPAEKLEQAVKLAVPHRGCSRFGPAAGTAEDWPGCIAE